MKFKYIDKKGLERDEHGKRTGFKVYIKVRRRMSRDGFDRWGIYQKLHISKSPYIWRYYASSRACGDLNGIPIEIMGDDYKLKRYLIDHFLLETNVLYAIHGWGHRKTPWHVGLTKKLFTIVVLNPETYACKFKTYARFERYWFRREAKERRWNIAHHR